MHHCIFSHPTPYPSTVGALFTAPSSPPPPPASCWLSPQTSCLTGPNSWPLFFPHPYFSSWSCLPPPISSPVKIFSSSHPGPSLPLTAFFLAKSLCISVWLLPFHIPEPPGSPVCNTEWDQAVQKLCLRHQKTEIPSFLVLSLSFSYPFLLCFAKHS